MIIKNILILLITLLVPPLAALRAAETAQEIPLFAFIAPNAPHTPHVLPKEYYEHYLEIPQVKHIAKFYGMTAFVCSIRRWTTITSSMARRVKGISGQVCKAYFFSNKERLLTFTQKDGDVSVNLPAKAPDAIASVLCLEYATENEK